MDIVLLQLKYVGSHLHDNKCAMPESEKEIDDEGCVTVWTKRAMQAIKRSKGVNRKDIESIKCKSVSRVILLKQSSY
jgi:hypothetical protein